jgi:hypothetical protein
MLSLALAWAEVLGSKDIFVGVNAVDYSGYPDCRPEYIAAFERMARLATKAAVEGATLHVHAPLINLGKAQIIQRRRRARRRLRAHRFLLPGGFIRRACGVCDSCRLRRAGFVAAGVPIRRATPPDRCLAGKPGRLHRQAFFAGNRACNQDLVDTIVIHVDDFEAQLGELEMVCGLGNMTEERT